MKKKELVAKATEILRARDARKTVPPARSKLYVRDEEGNQSTFTVVRKQKAIPLNDQDVSVVIDAVLEAIVDNVRNGGELSLYGMGTLAPRYRAPRRIKNPAGEGMLDVPPHLIMNYSPGKYVRTAIRLFEQSQTEEDMKRYSTKYAAPEDEEEEDDGD